METEIRNEPSYPFGTYKIYIFLKTIIFRHIEVLYFCRDGRILPALGQQSFAMIDLEQPNLLRLYNIDEEIRDALKSAVIRIQPHLEQISDANDYSEFRWKDPVWNHVASMISLLFN